MPKEKGASQNGADEKGSGEAIAIDPLENYDCTEVTKVQKEKKEKKRKLEEKKEDKSEKAAKYSRSETTHSISDAGDDETVEVLFERVPGADRERANSSTHDAEIGQLKSAINTMANSMNSFFSYMGVGTSGEYGPEYDDEGANDAVDKMADGDAEADLVSAGPSTAGDFLDGISNYFDAKEDWDPPINEKLAKIVNKISTNRMEDTKLREQTDKYKRPENCEHLGVTKVDPEIWAKLSPSVRGKDLKLQKVQGTLTKGVLPLVQATDDLYESLQDPKRELDVRGTVTKLVEATALLMDANMEINARRREGILPDLNARYRQLSTNQEHTSKF